MDVAHGIALSLDLIADLHLQAAYSASAKSKVSRVNYYQSVCYLASGKTNPAIFLQDHFH
jgi:hypothetical protein